MAAEPSFDVLMTQLQAGDAGAAEEIFHRFAGQLIALARRRLHAGVRPKVDAEDVVQSVFKSFFLRQADGRVEPANWESLWGLLVVITLRKCGRTVQYFSGLGRDVRREVASPGPDDSYAAFEAISREPTPEEAAALTETVEQVLRPLAERERQVLELRLQGYTVPEISTAVGRTEFTVEGILKKVRKHLRCVLQVPAGP